MSEAMLTASQKWTKNLWVFSMGGIICFLRNVKVSAWFEYAVPGKGIIAFQTSAINDSRPGGNGHEFFCVNSGTVLNENQFFRFQFFAIGIRQYYRIPGDQFTQPFFISAIDVL